MASGIPRRQWLKGCNPSGTHANRSVPTDELSAELGHPQCPHPVFGVTLPAPLRANRGSSLQNDAPKCPCDGSIAKLLEKAGGPDRSVEGLACPCVAFCLAEENGSSWTRRRKDSPCRSFIWLDQSQPRCATTGRTYADTLMSGGAVHHRPLVRRTSCGLIEG